MAIGLSVAGAPGAGAAVDTPLVTSFTTSALRNDFNGWVGMRIQGGGSDLSVTALGRWVVSGNSQSHAVKLVNATTGTQVATATVATSGQPAGTFAYTALGSPVTLLARTTYYLLSEEFAGGDSWYDYNTATVTTSAASNTGVVWAAAATPSSFNAGGLDGQSYGVPNLKYVSTNAAPAITQQPASQTAYAGDTVVFTASASGVPAPTVQWQSKAPAAGSFSNIGGATSTVLTVPNVTVGASGTQYQAVFSNASGPPATTTAATLTVNAGPSPTGTALVTYFTPSALRNDFSGWVGMRIQVGSSDLSVSALGRWVVSGNSQAHPVRLVNAVTGVEVASASVATSGQPAGAFAYTTLGSPVNLLANTTYYLLSQEFAGGDTWFDYNTATITTSAASDTGVVWAMGTSGPYYAGGAAGQSFGVPNLRYSSVNAAPAITQQPADQTVAAGGTAVFSASASGVPTPTVQWESKAPAAGSFSPVGGATSTILNVPNVAAGASGTQYRAVFSNTSGPPATTNAATLTVTASPPVAGTALVSYFTPSALRNEFDGWVGMRIQVGASNLSVSSLGRWVIAGNTQSHPQRLVTTSGTELATATVNTSGQPAGAFAYATLGAPVTLSANTTYYLLSQEFAGGDTWYDYNTAVITTSAASDTGVVWTTTAAPNTYNAGGSAGQSYGVPNLRYAVLNSAPTDIALTAASVAENQPSGTAVGTLSTTDADAGDTHTYTLVTGTGDTDNGSFQIVGNALQTAASFNFEAKSSYSIRIRTTDSGTPNLTYEEPFTITVTNVNDAPSDIGLTGTSVPENAPSNTTVGSLSTTDQDAGQTYTYTLVSGTGSTDNASFNINGTALRTSVSFNYEVKNSYSIRVRTTDNGTPNLNFEEQFTITVTDINDAPTAVSDSYTGAVGNTLFVLNSGGTGPKVTITGSVITANDTDEDATFPHTLSAVVETVSSTGGGSATIASDGTFTFLPGAGDKSQNDTFTYHVTDGSLATAGTVTVTIGADRAWYVDNALGVNGDGRSTSPFNTLSAINGAGGSGDADAADDYLFLYQGSANYVGGLPLETNQRLSGQPEGFKVGATTLLAASGSRPTITNTNSGGAGIALANNNVIRGVVVSGTSGAGITGASVATADIGANVLITNSTGAAFSLTGAATGNITMAANITHSSGSGRSFLVTARTGGTVTMSGAINDTGGGIQLTNNTGATINFTGGMTVSAGNSQAFTATGGGTVSVTGINTLTGALGLEVQNTTIGASGLTFQSIDSDGSANGILLNATGSSGGLTVTGTGTPVTAGSGGTIKNKTGAGISLTSVGSPVSLSGMATTTVAGADVLVNGGAANVTYAGTINNSGGRSVDVSNKTGGTVLFSGAITDNGTGISLVTNGSTILNFTGGLTMSTGANNAFSATGSGTVNVTGSANTITTTTGTALNVNSVNIGASGLTFRSISAGTAASGPANGIVLNSTGATAGLTVTGTGSAGSGGTIQRTTGAGVLLTSTRSPSLSWMNITNTGGSGIRGTGVTNVTIANNSISNSGTALGVEDSNISFSFPATSAKNNLSGVVSITNNTLSTPYYQGIDIYNLDGTISDANISNNTITSSTSTASSKGGGIRFVAFGDAATVANITKATLDNNDIFNFPSGVGLQVQCGNANSSSAPAATCGTNGSGTNIINITNSTIQGQSAAARFGAEGMVVLVNGRGQGNFNITGNSISHTTGTALSHSAFGNATVTSTISSNTIVANNTVASQGIGVGLSTTGGFATNTPTMTTTISNNNISQVDGNGILAVARDASGGVLNAKIQNNTVSAPLSGVRPGIRVDAGNATGDNDVCLNISGNTSAGSGGTQGIGLRKQGTSTTVNAFAVNGMSATSTPGVENYVNGLNPAGNGTLLISATSGFSNCSLP